MKITMYQGSTEYQSLHIMITDNPRFMENKLCIDDVEGLIGRVRAWAEKNLEGQDGRQLTGA